MGNFNEKVKQELLMVLEAHYDLHVVLAVEVVSEHSLVYDLERSKDL